MWPLCGNRKLYISTEFSLCFKFQPNFMNINMEHEEWITRNVFVQNSKWAQKEPSLPLLRKEVNSLRAEQARRIYCVLSATYLTREYHFISIWLHTAYSFPQIRVLNYCNTFFIVWLIVCLWLLNERSCSEKPLGLISLPLSIKLYHCFGLTHLPLVPHMCVSKPSQHQFR